MNGVPERSAETLAILAANPAAIGAQQATLFAGLDAIADAYMAAQPAGLSDAQRAMRKPAAVWAAIQAHAETRVAMAKREAAPK